MDVDVTGHQGHIARCPIVKTCELPIDKARPCPLEKPDYEGVLHACARGDHDALKFLYDREARWLMGVILRIVRNHHRAEDVLQEAFLSIWQRAGTFDASRGSGKGWIYTVVRHRALKEVRRNIPQDNLDFVDVDNLAELGQFREVEFLGVVSAELERCLALLEPQKRRCIVLAFVEGFTQRQIAERLDVPLGTVKAWIRRGLLSLRKSLSELQTADDRS